MKNHKLIISIVGLVVIVILGIGIWQFLVLQKAHSSFNNYYNFRGCKTLLVQTDTYGLCQLSDGKMIKIVEFHNKWYLNGDLPTCVGGVCL
jgi:hypothetical protein